MTEKEKIIHLISAIPDLNVLAQYMVRKLVGNGKKINIMSFEQIIKVLEILVPLLSTILSVIALSIAIIAMKRDKKRFSTTIETDIFFKFTEKFTSREYIEKRKNLALRMSEISQARESVKGKEDEEVVIRCLEKDDVIDFFQVVGLIYRSREELMDVRLLHSKFTWWLSHYFHFFADEINMQRKRDKGVWADAVWLHDQFLKLNKEVGRTIDENSINRFIDYERSLK